MTEGAYPSTVRGQLAPVRRRGVWVAWGLVLQVVGVAIPAAVAFDRINHDDAVGTVTHYTFRLVLHEMLRRRADVALVVLGVIVFAAGSVVLARPFVTGRLALFVAVPLAAVAGIAVFGLIAVVIAAILAIGANGGGGGGASDLAGGLMDWPFDGGRRRRR